MNQLVSISDIGSIRILNVPLGAKVEYARQALQVYNLQENDNCLYIEELSIGKLPKINIHLSKSKDNRIDRIYIGNSQLSQKESDLLYAFFKKTLSPLNIFSEKEDEIILTNLLHRVTIGKQKGINNNENRYPFFLHIIGRLMVCDERQLRDAMTQLYMGKKEVKQQKEKSVRTLRVLLIVIALAFAYLFALNGRYEPVGQHGTIIFDKWTQKAILPDDYLE